MHFGTAFPTFYHKKDVMTLTIWIEIWKCHVIGKINFFATVSSIMISKWGSILEILVISYYLCFHHKIYFLKWMYFFQVLEDWWFFDGFINDELGEVNSFKLRSNRKLNNNWFVEEFFHNSLNKERACSFYIKFSLN